MSRAIVLGGGGPTGGVPIGVILAAGKAGIEFDVWALSGVGAWVGVVYNQCPGDYLQRATETMRFIREAAFVPDAQYRDLPMSPIFTPDFVGLSEAMMQFVANPENYHGHIGSFLTRMVWQSASSGITGSGRLAAEALDFNRLYQNPAFIYFNSFNLDRKQIKQFANRPWPGDTPYGTIDATSLSACTAIPFLESVVRIDGERYCEGAMHTVMNFYNLLEDNIDLEEIWVVRLIGDQQINPPKNLTNALENLIMIPVGSLGANEIKLFRAKIDAMGWPGRLYEIPVSPDVNFDWTYSNLFRGVASGYRAVEQMLERAPLQQVHVAP